MSMPEPRWRSGIAIEIANAAALNPRRTDAEIAAILGLSRRTVSRHRATLPEALRRRRGRPPEEPRITARLTAEELDAVIRARRGR